jgi:distribution and morphology protein 12
VTGFDLMSIDLNWEALTTGPEGIALAEKIRDFVHEKFQSVPLPRFIKGVKVHAFEFGSIAPELEIKDICDPLPDFYEETEDDYGEDDDEYPDGGSDNSLREKRRTERLDRMNGGGARQPSLIDARLRGLSQTGIGGDIGSPFLGVSTPGISGGMSSLNYFHSHLASGRSGTQTPLAAVAGAHLPNGWPDYSNLPSISGGHRRGASNSSLSPPPTANSHAPPFLRERESVSTLAPSTSTTRPQTREGLVSEAEEEEEEEEETRRFREPRVEDLQTVFRIRYAGNIKLSLTTEILLDYPMPSFVGIPVKLNITGLSFDGVAVLAYIRKRAHFCFLSPEDAYAAIGPDSESEVKGGMKMGVLLHDIKVESEIGQREGGKQVLKNVGKVEKFVLEQVRRIFEDEFVYPSFWTFLI